MDKKATIILVPSSHWDREWYLSYRRTQMRLVRLINKVLHLTAGEGYSFLLDGQTIMLEDYLEIYPEHEELMKQRVSEGKIVPGPWYTVPDTAIPCGEGLVRNLQEGQALCQRFGGGLKTAFTPDTFGQASQMPQIYKLFGFDRTMFTRGVWDGTGDSDPRVLEWIGADGTKLTTLNSSYNEALFLTVKDIWKSFDKTTLDYETCKQNFEKLMARQERTWNSKVRLAIVGIDHMEPIRELPDYVKCLQQDFPEYALRLGTMDEFFDLLEKEVEQDPDFVVPVCGEQRGDPDLIFPLANTLSTRMDLKDLLRQAENRLQYLCGPLAAFCPVTDDFNDVETGNYCRQAWRLLAACQAHDSICMCNTDQTNRDVANRLDQANQMSREAEKILQQRLGESIAPLRIVRESAAQAERDSAVCTADSGVGEITSAAALVVYNPLPFNRSEYVKGQTWIPSYAPGMKLVNAEGKAVPGAVIRETFRKRRDIESMKLNEYEEVLKDNTRVPLNNMSEQDWYIGVEYEFEAANVPACGWQTYYLVAETEEIACANDVKVADVVEQVRGAAVEEGIDIADMLAGNEKASTAAVLSVYMDGDQMVFTKDNEVLYKVHFEEETDLGDSYTFMPGGDLQVMPAVGESSVTYESGRMMLTQEFALERADGTVSLQAIVTIPEGSDKPEFDFAVENQSVGHRLRMIVTTTEKCTECFGDSVFDLPRRPVLPENRDCMHVRTRSMRNLAGIVGEKVIAVFGSGMRECETALTEDGTFMALTILRSTARVYSTGLSNRPEGGKPDFVRWHTEDSRMLGSYSTRCTLAVYPAEVSDLTLHNDALSWQIPLNVFGAWAHGTAPDGGSFMSVEGAVLSTVLEKENGMAVRVFADKDGGVCTVDVKKTVAGVRLVDLMGRALSDDPNTAQICGSVITLTLKPCQIATLELTFA